VGARETAKRKGENAPDAEVGRHVEEVGGCVIGVLVAVRVVRIAKKLGLLVVDWCCANVSDVVLLRNVNTALRAKWLD
jgi:uncharacterized membrane protein YccC